MTSRIWRTEDGSRSSDNDTTPRVPASNAASVLSSKAHASRASASSDRLEGSRRTGLPRVERADWPRLFGDNMLATARCVPEDRLPADRAAEIRRPPSAGGPR